MNRAPAISSVAFLLLVSACTWVKLTPQGEKVSVKNTAQVSQCKKLGRTEVALKDKVAGIKRNKEKVAGELQTLARNSGGKMGGNAVVAISDIVDGAQEYAVYLCN